MPLRAQTAQRNDEYPVRPPVRRFSHAGDNSQKSRVGRAQLEEPKKRTISNRENEFPHRTCALVKLHKDVAPVKLCGAPIKLPENALPRRCSCLLAKDVHSHDPYDNALTHGNGRVNSGSARGTAVWGSYNWGMTEFTHISNAAASTETAAHAAATAAADNGATATVDTPIDAAATSPDNGDAPTHIRLFGATPDSIVDGPGLRYAIFVQGCTHGCPGCHNPESWAPDGGTLTTIDALMADIKASGLTQGVTLTGGDPFDQVETSAEVARRVKEAGFNLWTFTGYLYEDLLREAESAASAESCTHARSGAGARARAIRDLLAATDVLVDGPFIEGQRSLELQWRGSANQRLIDLPATRAAGRIVEWRAPTFDTQKPESW